MNADTLLRDVLTQLGVYSVFTLSVAVVLRSAFDAWLTRKIAAGVEEGMRRRLAELQLDLDKELEKHRSALAEDAERLRSRLERETTDYGIWAQKRHDATAALFAKFLAAEVVVSDRAELSCPNPETATENVIADFAERLRLPHATKESLLELHRLQRHGELGRQMERAAEAEQRARIIQARNDAYEAYYEAALYLSDDVDAAAREVRDHFHTVTIPYVAGSESLGMEILRNRQKLRLLMLELQNRARSDLARSTI